MVCRPPHASSPAAAPDARAAPALTVRPRACARARRTWPTRGARWRAAGGGAASASAGGGRAAARRTGWRTWSARPPQRGAAGRAGRAPTRRPGRAGEPHRPAVRRAGLRGAALVRLRGAARAAVPGARSRRDVSRRERPLPMVAGRPTRRLRARRARAAAGGPREQAVRGGRLRHYQFLRLPGRAQAALQGAHARRHGARPPRDPGEQSGSDRQAR